MRGEIVENSIVANIIMGSVEGSIECADEVSIGWVYSDGSFAAPAEVVDLQELKAEIDAAAEAERKKYIIAGEGQAMTYQRKAEEAKGLPVGNRPAANRLSDAGGRNRDYRRNTGRRRRGCQCGS